MSDLSPEAKARRAAMERERYAAKREATETIVPRRRAKPMRVEPCVPHKNAPCSQCAEADGSLECKVVRIPLLGEFRADDVRQRHDPKHLNLARSIDETVEHVLGLVTIEIEIPTPEEEKARKGGRPRKSPKAIEPAIELVPDEEFS